MPRRSDLIAADLLPFVHVRFASVFTAKRWKGYMRVQDTEGVTAKY
jgi:hypothetical protein